MFRQPYSEMHTEITYGVAETNADLNDILKLQRENLPVNISSQELMEQGFVTVHHDFDLLLRMNSPYPHIVAKTKDELVGYALVMRRAFSQALPVLVPMFEQLDSLNYNGVSLKDQSYFVMGQVCVKKGFRGQGILSGMYVEMQARMKEHFDYIVTEISTRNMRSLRAHQKVGFEEIHAFRSEDGEHWKIILLRLNG